MKYARRSFLASTGIASLAAYLESCTPTPPGPGGPKGTPGALVRPSAYSPAGKAMLVKYADAVNQMKTSIAEGSPTSWVFQWYTHAVRADQTKASELARIYPAPSPQRDLAVEMWSTCQPHHAGGVEDYFLPWHRMYVLYFEQIVRKLCGDPAFVLPYWNYSVTGADHGIIPPEFRDSTSSLFQSNRRPGPNAGQAIDQTAPGALSLDSLEQTTYSPSGANPGFCSDLDGGLHGNVHGLVGGSMNMGSVPWAARDAVFWMHHCNIDRLWASWNQNGGLNPTDATWTGKEFVFADADGNRVTKTNGEVSDIAMLGYSYDALEPAPPGFAPATSAVTAPLITTMVTAPTAMVARSVSLGAAPARAELRPGAPGAGAQGFAARVQALAADKNLHLVLRDIQAPANPAVLYGVYLNLPANAPEADRENFRVGYINFFEPAAHAGMGGEAASALPHFRSFKVTELLRRQHAAGALAGSPSVTLLPMGTPDEGASATVGEISLVEQ